MRGAICLAGASGPVRLKMVAKTLTSRRAILSGRQIARVLGALSRELAEAGAEVASREQPVERLVKLSRDAMACRFDILLQPEHADRLADAIIALDEVDRLEEQMSVYVPDSEVSRINAVAGQRAVAVERRLFKLFQTAARISADTGGAFDLTTGPVTRCWGFHQRNGRVPSDHELAAARERVGMRHLRLSEAEHTVHFEREGVELNLGAIGKGYALDRVGEVLGSKGCGSFLVQSGASSLLARGDGTMGQGWLVGIRHPLDRERRLAEVRLRNAAMSTSDAAHQYFRANGKRYGHIIDPRTGRPAEGVLSATAIAPTAAESDALATAFYVMGLDETRSYCRARPSVGAVLAAPSADGRSEVAGVNVERFDLEIPG